MKRNLFLWHRYLGILLGLLFAIWFVSGVVMMYVRMPILSAEDRFPLLPRFAPSAFTVPVSDAWAATARDDEPRRMRLATLLDRPIYYFLPPGARWVGVYGDTGMPLGGVDRELARRVARQYAPADVEPEYLGYVEGVDQWTLTNSLNLHRPLYRFALGDSRRTEMYVSAQTGEVVMRTTRLERTLAWFGPIVHWVAPEFLRVHVGAWRQTIIWLSAAGTALVLTGLWIGVLRYRHRGYPVRGEAGPERRRSPYIGAKLQHHWAGLLFGIVTLTWIVSGLLYMNPGGRHQGDLSTTTQVTPYSIGGVRGSQAPRPGQAEALRGGPIDPFAWTLAPGDAWAQVGALDPPKEVELVRFAGRPYYVFYTDAMESVTVAADRAGTEPRRRHPLDTLLTQAALAVPGASIADAQLLDRYDAYYYSVGSVPQKRLPILRVWFDDPTSTLMYVDPHTGTIFRTYDRQARVMRWLVIGLHCLDFPFLMFNRPAWDLTIITLSGGGFLLSLTGVVMAWRRVRPARRKPRTMTAPHARPARKIAGLLLAGVLLPASLLAAQGGGQAPPTSDEDDGSARHFEQVVVTASRQEERVSDLPVTVQTFDRRDIERSAATSVTEFLAERGVAFFSSWTPAQTSVNIRGGASDGQGRDFRSQVVVLLNGRRAGTANVSKLSLHDVRRIEVLRGPGSLLYGSQALGGVINLITKDGLRDPGTYLRVNGGSFGLFDTVVQHGDRIGRWDYFASGHGGRQGDYQAGRGAVERPQANTGYQQGGGLFALGYTIDAFNRVSVTARTDGMYNAGFRGSSWDTNNDEDRTNRSAEVLYTGQTPAGRASWNVQSSWFRDLDNFRWGSEVIRLGSGLPGAGFESDTVNRRQQGLVLQASSALRATESNSLLVGTDSEWTRLRNNRLRTPVPGGATSQVPPFDNNSNSRNVGIYVEDVQRLLDDVLLVRGGVRYDNGRHEVRATPHAPAIAERAATYDALTYRLGTTVRPAPGAALRASVGTGYRAPTATELAVDFTTVLGGQIVGNPDLRPERTTSIEVGGALEQERFWVDLALFRNAIRDRIATVPEFPGANRSIYQNRHESEVIGLEWQSRIELATLGAGSQVWLGLNGVYNMRMRDLDAAERNLNTDRIERMYESQGSVVLGVDGRAWSGQLLGTYNGRLWYDTEENLLIPEAEPFRTFIHEKRPFMLWSLRGRRALADGLWVTGAVNNLLNRNDHPLFIATNREPLLADLRFSNGGVGNSMPGRAFVVGLEFRR